jgi:hypothetical protein
MLHRLSTLGFLSDTRVAGPDVLWYPRAWSLRAGALPLIAHELGHILVERHPETVRNVVEWLMKRSESDIRRRQRALAERASSAGFMNNGLAAGATIIRDLQTMRDFQRVVRRRAEELLCDWVGAALVGPAYVFALARFALGELSPSERDLREFPSLKLRLETCKSLLAQMDITVPLRTSLFTIKRCGLPAGILESLVEMGLTLYTREEHEAALERCVPALSKGSILRSSAPLLLNALWSGVVKRKAYINEVALYFSLAAGDGWTAVCSDA